MRRFSFILPALLAVLFPLSAPCAEESIGTVMAVKGEVRVTRQGVTLDRSLKVMDPLYLHDRIATREGAALTILLTDNSVVTIDEKSTLDLADYVYNTEKGVRKGALNLILGSIRAQLNRSGFAEEEFLVRTDNAIAGVKGTDFIVKILAASVTKVFVLEGAVAVRNRFLPDVVRMITAGQFTEVLERKAPALPEVMKEPLLNGLKRQFSLRAEVTRPAADLPQSAAAARGRIPSLEARVEKAVTTQREPGGGGISYGFYNPQVSGQIGLEPPAAAAGPAVSPGGRPASGGGGSAPSGGGGGSFPRGALEEVFGGSR